MKYIIDSDKRTSAMGRKEIADLLDSNKAADNAETNMLLKYLNSFEPDAYTTQPLFDPMTTDKVKDADNLYTDGTYYWYDCDVYLIRKYGLTATKEFMKHVKEKSQ